MGYDDSARVHSPAAGGMSERVHSPWTGDFEYEAGPVSTFTFCFNYWVNSKIYLFNNQREICDLNKFLGGRTNG